MIAGSTGTRVARSIVFSPRREMVVQSDRNGGWCYPTRIMGSNRLIFFSDDASLARVAHSRKCNLLNTPTILPVSLF